MTKFWQAEYVRENVAMVANSTYLLDLPEFGLLGSILVRITGSDIAAFGAAGGDWRIIDKISKIVVIGDQSYTIKSITGKQAAALCAYDQGMLPPSEWQNYWTNTQYEYLLINFGRWFKDDSMGLDLSRFKNVQLQVTNTANLTSDFSDLTISVLGYYLREAPAGQFAGFMRTENWREWTTVADETQYLEIPVDLKVRRILLAAKALVTATLDITAAHNLMDDIDLSLDTGQVRVFKGGWDDLVRENILLNGRLFLATGKSYQNADAGFDMGLGRVTGHVAGAGSATLAVAATFPSVESGRSGRNMKFEDHTVDCPTQIIVVGMAPFGVAKLDFGDGWDPSWWLDPNERKTVKLNIHTRSHADSAGGTNSVILDRFVP